MQLPKRRSDQFKKVDDGPVYLTKAGVGKLERSLSRLEADLPQAITEVERTKEFGDFSENAEYKEAKFKLRKMHSRIFGIKEKLKRVVLIDPNKSTSWIEIGSTVVLESSGLQKTYQILGSIESDPARGRISQASPLGKVLLGKKVGEIVKIETKKGEAKYSIIEIK